MTRAGPSPISLARAEKPSSCFFQFARHYGTQLPLQVLKKSIILFQKALKLFKRLLRKAYNFLQKRFVQSIQNHFGIRLEKDLI